MRRGLRSASCIGWPRAHRDVNSVDFYEILFRSVWVVGWDMARRLILVFCRPVWVPSDGRQRSRSGDLTRSLIRHVPLTTDKLVSRAARESVERQECRLYTVRTDWRSHRPPPPRPTPVGVPFLDTRTPNALPVHVSTRGGGCCGGLTLTVFSFTSLGFFFLGGGV